MVSAADEGGAPKTLAGPAVDVAMRAQEKLRRSTLMFENLPWFSPAIAPAPLPLGLKHVDSDLCWCDPVVETNEDGAEVILHNQVTWN